MAPLRILISASIGLYLGLAPSRAGEAAGQFPVLPLPPEIKGLIAMPPVYSHGRKANWPLVKREAERWGIPTALADAVAQVESGYNPNAVGAVGEIGLMQIRPSTAAMLGYTGEVNGLFAPQTNISYSVMYLAGAWRLAAGDLCRALMKYRAGHGEERMTPLSIEYCQRARSYLAAIGSELAKGAGPVSEGPPIPSATRKPAGLKVASLGQPTLSEAQARGLARAREQRSVRKAKIRQIWTAHEQRLRSIEAKLKPSQLRIAAGI